MLRTLSIRNFALIEDAQIDLEPGLIVWTGETGSGKSMLLSAIGLVLGSKADAGSVRAGAAEAIVSCTFEVNRPDIRAQLEVIVGGAIEDDDLIVTRRVNATTGRNSSSVNGVQAPVKVLQALGRVLLDYVGQHQTRSLTEPVTQMNLVDQFGSLGPVHSAFLAARQAYEAARLKRRQEIETVARDSRERELLRFELDELDRLEPVAHEPARLMEEARRLARADEIRKITSDTYAKLYGADASIHDQLARMARRLAPIAGLSSQLKEASEILQGLLEQMVDASSLLSESAENAEANPKRLDTIEQRLADYRRLSARLSTTEDGLADVREAHRKRIDEMDLRQKKISDDTHLRQLWGVALEAGRQLGLKRAEAAVKLAKEIRKPLSKLGLQSAEVQIDVLFESWPNFGDDMPIAPENPARILMQFRPNPGEPARPLERIASGGELSRLLLAILACMAESDHIPTVILDEIDTGVGGRLGGAVAEVLKELAAHHQVICVTHLPQIAAAADNHFLVKKSKRSGRTCTTVTLLSTHTHRAQELAQMMRGSKADDLTLKQAKAMLSNQTDTAPAARVGKPVKAGRRAKS